MEKALDVLAEGLITKESRADRTPVELFCQELVKVVGQNRCTSEIDWLC